MTCERSRKDPRLLSPPNPQTERVWADPCLQDLGPAPKPPALGPYHPQLLHCPEDSLGSHQPSGGSPASLPPCPRASSPAPPYGQLCSAHRRTAGEGACSWGSRLRWRIRGPGHLKGSLRGGRARLRGLEEFWSAAFYLGDGEQVPQGSTPSKQWPPSALCSPPGWLRPQPRPCLMPVDVPAPSRAGMYVLVPSTAHGVWHSACTWWPSPL